jgi:dethiobiotin synthetase
VPLNERETLADLVKQLQIPVILVVGMKLGCLNHAILSARAIQLDGVRIAGWIANSVQPYFPELQDNVAILQSMLSAPCLGVIPHCQPLDLPRMAAGLKTNLLFPTP